MFDSPRVSKLKTELRDAQDDLRVKQGLHALTPTVQYAGHVTSAHANIKRIVQLIIKESKRI